MALFAVSLGGLLAAVEGCGRDERLGAASDLTAVYRTTWLGSAEGWGLLGLPTAGGVVAYRSAQTLESPTWAPPELGAVASAVPTLGAIWVKSQDGRLGSFDYSTGRLVAYGELAPRSLLGYAPSDESMILVSPDSAVLSLVGRGEPWRYALAGPLIDIRPAGGERIVTLARAEAAVEISVLRPPESEPLARTTVEGLRDFVVTAWGRRLYYLPEDPGDPHVRGLSLPELKSVDALPLSGPGTALSATPSGHRLYVAVDTRLEVFDRLAGQRVDTLEMPAPVSALRFGETGTALLGRVEDRDQAVVLQVGVDSVLGVISSQWSDQLPAALPGGRLIAAPDSELVLYTLPDLVQIARIPDEPGARLWIPVEWHPPRPRPELVRRLPGAPGDTARLGGTAAPQTLPVGPRPEEERVVRPGFYAVVLAARTRPGVDSLVNWLKSVGYTATLQRHRDNNRVIWYRAMIGPYDSRIKAESAARTLSARYGVYKPWILTVTEADTAPVRSEDPDLEPAPGRDEAAGTEDASVSGHGPDTTGITGDPDAVERLPDSEVEEPEPSQGMNGTV